MPIYEYRCENGHTFDVMQRMGDPPVTKCDLDGGAVERVFNAPAVHFKGSGFYSTDYGSKKRARENKDASEAKSKSNGDSGSSDSGSSDSGSSDSASSSETKSDSSASSSSKTDKKSATKD
jgi:putative FmdB family regulatory protein